MAALHYEPTTGVFTWRIASARRIKVGDIAGRSNTGGYWRIHLRGKSYPAHHVAWLYVYGVWPRDCLDHINQNRSDNRIENLREANGALNRQNTKLQSNNTSGFKGVSKCGASRRWRAEIMIDGRAVRLGWFDTPEEASEAYLAVKRQIHPFYVEGRGVRRD